MMMGDVIDNYIGLRGELFGRDNASFGNWIIHYATYAGFDPNRREISVQLAPCISTQEALSAVRRFKPKLQADNELRNYVIPTLERMLRRGERAINTWVFD